MLDSYICKKVTIDISESTTVSSEVDINGYQVVGIIPPADWTAANVTFQIDPGDGGGFRVVAGLTLTTPTANQITFLNTGAAAPYIIPIVVGHAVKIVSSTAQLTADKVVTVLLQKLP